MYSDNNSLVTADLSASRILPEYRYTRVVDVVKIVKPARIWVYFHHPLGGRLRFAQFEKNADLNLANRIKMVYILLYL
jgi:hypothetical protein